MKEALPAAAHGKPIEIWFQDEARIGQKGTLTRLWARIGSRPRAPRDSRYEWAYLFGAVCPERATGVALVMPYANSEAMNLHLREIGRAVAPGAHAILVLDGAGWHTSHILTPPDNLTLLCLPPYSPELNPVENVWEYLRKNNPRPARLRHLRRHRRRLLQRLDRPHRNPRQDRIHHPPPMGSRVMSSGGWYNRLGEVRPRNGLTRSLNFLCLS